MRTLDQLTIAVASVGDPRDPSLNSGAPHQLLSALRELRVQTIALVGVLPDPWERGLVGAVSAARARPRRPSELRRWPQLRRSARNGAILGPSIGRVHDLHIARQLRTRPVDGVIQYGSAMRMPKGVDMVIFEDSTVAQAQHAYAWEYREGLTSADVELMEVRARAVYARVRAACPMTHWAAESIRLDYAVPPTRIHVVGVGCNHPLEPPAVRDWSSPRYLFVGVDWERKNGPAVLRAFARVRAQRPDAALELVGGHPRVDAPGVNAHGPLPLGEPAAARRLRELFLRATCFVMPSLHEPAGQVYLEAASAGLPSIGTTDGGAATMIGDGGIVVDPRDEDAIALAMLELAEADRARELGRRAQARAALLDWRSVAERLIRALAPAGLPVDELARFL